MSEQNSYVKQNASNSVAVLSWSALWGATLPMGLAAMYFLAPLSNALIALLVIAHLFFAFMALNAHKKWFIQLDELQKQIQLNAMVFTLGITWIGNLLLLLLDLLDVIEIGMDHLALLAVLMAVVGTIARVVNLRKVA